MTNAPPTAPDEVVLEVQGLRKRWPNGAVALDGVDLTVTRADVFVILGPNGCGKSTFLRCLNLLEPYQEGRVLLRGEEASRGRPLGHVPDRAEQRRTATPPSAAGPAGRPRRRCPRSSRTARPRWAR